MARFTIVGGTGFMGSALCKAALSQGHVCQVLSRGRNQSNSYALDQLRIRGAEIAFADLADADSLTAQFFGSDVVISTIGEGGAHDNIEPALLQSAADAGVKRFLPNEFGVNTLAAPEGINLLIDAKKAFHQTLQESDVAFTAIFPGALFDVYLPNLRRGPAITRYGSNERAANYTHSLDDLAVLAIRAALDERCANAFLQMDTNKVSQTDALACLHHTYPIYRFKETHVSEDEMLDGSRPLLKAVYVDGLAALTNEQSMSINTLYPDYACRKWDEALRDPGFVFGKRS